MDIKQSLMNQEEIKSFIISACKFEYDSYDHKKALNDYITSYDGQTYLNNNKWVNAINFNEYSYIPTKYKIKHRVKRIGKLRDLSVSPNGDIIKFRIGNKWAKTFYQSDFGVSVKPILNPCNDKYDLIKRGLAIDAIKYSFNI